MVFQNPPGLFAGAARPVTRSSSADLRPSGTLSPQGRGESRPRLACFRFLSPLRGEGLGVRGRGAARSAHLLSSRTASRLLAIFLALLAGCRSEMYDQARYEPYEPTGFFADGTSSRPILAGTVERRVDRDLGNTSLELFETGMEGGKPAERFPMPVDRALLERGQERFRIFCTPCHGELGDGRGVVVARGFNPPPTYHSDALRQQPPGHFVDVMTQGFGTMYSYAARVPPRDRWAIAAYLKALQLSQNAVVRDLPSADRDHLSNSNP
jgi:hypothetical protein